MPLLVAEQRTESWHTARQGRITASLAAACLGLDPYTSAAAAWRQIMGMEGGHDNAHTRWGVQSEPLARLAYECESGNLAETTGFWIHPELDWLGASPDGLIGSAGLAEIKCPGRLPANIPLHHRIQCLIQLAVTGRLWCDYFAWTPEGHFLRRIHPAGAQGLIGRLRRFHEEYVVPGLCPPRKKRHPSTRKDPLCSVTSPPEPPAPISTVDA